MWWSGGVVGWWGAHMCGHALGAALKDVAGGAGACRSGACISSSAAGVAGGRGAGAGAPVVGAATAGAGGGQQLPPQLSMESLRASAGASAAPASKPSTCEASNQP